MGVNRRDPDFDNRSAFDLLPDCMCWACKWARDKLKAHQTDSVRDSHRERQSDKPRKDVGV